MIHDNNELEKNKIELIKNVYNKALFDINKIIKDRDEKIKKLLKNIDNRHADKILEGIKNNK